MKDLTHVAVVLVLVALLTWRVPKLVWVLRAQVPPLLGPAMVVLVASLCQVEQLKLSEWKWCVSKLVVWQLRKCTRVHHWLLPKPLSLLALLASVGALLATQFHQSVHSVLALQDEKSASVQTASVRVMCRLLLLVMPVVVVLHTLTVLEARKDKTV